MIGFPIKKSRRDTCLNGKLALTDYSIIWLILILLSRTEISLSCPRDLHQIPCPHGANGCKGLTVEFVFNFWVGFLDLLQPSIIAVASLIIRYLTARLFTFQNRKRIADQQGYMCVSPLNPRRYRLKKTEA